MDHERALLLARRRAQARTHSTSLTAHHFAEQRAFYTSKKRLRAALDSRRAGKTRGGNESDLELASKTKHGRYLYINETRAEAKRLAWVGARGDGMASLVRSQKLPAVINESELTIHFPDLDSWIYLVGVDDERSIMKALGLPYHRVRWDEAQKIPPKFTQTIIETVLPTLLDYGGELLFTGTPDRKMSGIFYEITRTEPEKRRKGWEVHQWTLLANPYWGRAKQIDGRWFTVWGLHDAVVSGPHAENEIPAAITQARFKTGVLGLQELLGGPEVAPLDSPIMRRQAGGEWVREDSNYVYAVNKVPDHVLLYADARHRADGFPDVALALKDLPWDWRQGFYALGVDLGYNDPFTFTLWAWHPHDLNLYQVCSWKRSELDSDDQNAAIQAVRAHVAIGVIDADAGGIGKQVVKGWSREWVERYGLPIFEAEKQHKLTAIQTFNNDILRGRVKLRRGCVLLEEMRELQWATIVDGSGKMVEDPTMANDCCDGALYGHRRSFQYRWSPEDKKLQPGSPEAYLREEAELEDDAMDGAEEGTRYH